MLKYIAAITMFIGYFGVYTARELRFFNLPKPLISVLFQLQFIAQPIFFFFIAEGFNYPRSKKNYALRLLGAAVITQFVYVLCNGMKS
ncbi:MAG: hypothetical protein E7505_07030 [Ruminococcus sp.]|nr:hypothetical protein [Ruminococcus sp.]